MRLPVTACCHMVAVPDMGLVCGAASEAHLPRPWLERPAARQLPGLSTRPHRMCTAQVQGAARGLLTKDRLEGTQGGGRAYEVPGGPKGWGQGLSSPLQK